MLSLEVTGMPEAVANLEVESVGAAIHLLSNLTISVGAYQMIEHMTNLAGCSSGRPATFDASPEGLGKTGGVCDQTVRYRAC